MKAAAQRQEGLAVQQVPHIMRRPIDGVKEVDGGALNIRLALRSQGGAAGAKGCPEWLWRQALLLGGHKDGRGDGSREGAGSAAETARSQALRGGEGHTHDQQGLAAPEDGKAKGVQGSLRDKAPRRQGQGKGYKPCQALIIQRMAGSVKDGRHGAAHGLHNVMKACQGMGLLRLHCRGCSGSANAGNAVAQGGCAAQVGAEGEGVGAGHGAGAVHCQQQRAHLAGDGLKGSQGGAAEEKALLQRVQPDGGGAIRHASSNAGPSDACQGPKVPSPTGLRCLLDQPEL